MKHMLVKEIIEFSGTSDDYTYQWSAIVFVYEDDTRKIISKLGTSSDSPEDNDLGRIGTFDVEEIMKLISPTAAESQDLLYDYPKLVSLIEKSFLSVTMLDAN